MVELLRHHAPTFNKLDLYRLGHLNKSLTPGVGKVGPTCASGSEKNVTTEEILYKDTLYGILSQTENN